MNTCFVIDTIFNIDSVLCSVDVLISPDGQKPGALIKMSSVKQTVFGVAAHVCCEVEQK